MILVDTSVWIDHLRRNDARLASLLKAGHVLAHAFVTSELALGRLKRRGVILTAMADLPQARVATDQEVLHFIETQGLEGLGIGYVDAHLLAAAKLMPGTALWTRDKRLSTVAARLRLLPI